MWSELVSGAVGLVVGYAGSFLEPLRSRVAALGRASSSEISVDTHIESDPSVIWAGEPNWIPFQFFFPEAAPTEAPPPDGKGWRAWATTRGGFDLRESVVRVTVVSRAPVTVVLETPMVICTTEAAPEGVRAVYPVGGASIQPTAFYVDVDTFGPEFPQVHLTGEQGKDVKSPLTWSLGTGEAQTILLRVSSSSARLIYWSARIPLLIDGRRRYIDVNDEGKDFIFAGAEAGSEDYFFIRNDGDAARWTAQSDLP